MNIALWAVQILLALMFLMAGFAHASGRDNGRKGMEWMKAIPAGQLRAIGILEMLAAVGLVLPAATGILPWLTPLAATGLVILMIGAAVFHLRRPGENGLAVFNLVLGLLALFVAYGRFVLEPIS